MPIVHHSSLRDAVSWEQVRVFRDTIRDELFMDGKPGRFPLDTQQKVANIFQQQQWDTPDSNKEQQQ